MLPLPFFPKDTVIFVNPTLEVTEKTDNVNDLLLKEAANVRTALLGHDMSACQELWDSPCAIALQLVEGTFRVIFQASKC